MQMDDLFLKACQNGQKGVIQTFLKKGGINIDKRDEKGLTPLHYACQKGSRDIVRLLIENGADVTMETNTSVTPLHLAVMSGNKEIIKMLADAGADVNATDKEGRNSLMYGIRSEERRVGKEC